MKMCLAVVCVWKPDYLKSGHVYICTYGTNHPQLKQYNRPIKHGTQQAQKH